MSRVMQTVTRVCLLLLVACEVPTVSLGERAFFDAAVPDARRADADNDADDDSDEDSPGRPCRSDTDCSGDDPVCAARGVCVECRTDAQCRPDEICEPDGDCDSPD